MNRIHRLWRASLHVEILMLKGLGERPKDGCIHLKSFLSLMALTALDRLDDLYYGA